MTKTLKEKAVKGMIWKSIEMFGFQGIRFISYIILARLLMPRHFGLIGMLAIFIEISQTFLDSGFGQALIQKKNTNQTDYSTVFYFNIGIGFFLFTLLYLSAPLISSFYNEPQLIQITRVVGLTIIINSFAIIQNTILIKKINFKTLTKIRILSVVIAGTISIFMALNGFGVWSLVAHALTLRFLFTVLLWFQKKWLPSLEFSIDSFRRLFSFGSKLLASSLIRTVFDNIYLLVIGKAFSAETLGYYTQADRLQRLPSRSINIVFSQVTFPVFSKIQNNNQRLKRWCKSTIQGLAFINFPLMLGLMVIAKPLIVFLVGEKWLPVVPFFQLLCIVGLSYPIHSLNLNILRAKGRSDLFLRLAIIKKAITVLAIAICLPFGVLALIIGQVITSLIAYYINSYYSGRLIDYGIKEQLSDLKPYLISSVFMAIITWIIGILIRLNILIKLPIQIAVAVIIYLILTKLFKADALKESLNIIRSNILNSKFVRP